MYKAAVRWMIRRNIAALNHGRHQPVLAMFAPDATLSFPGINSSSGQFRTPTAGRTAFVSHRDRNEIEAFLRRYVDHRIQMSIEDILVNGPPWKTRIAVPAHVWASGPEGGDAYNNRAVLMINTRWGQDPRPRGLRRHRAGRRLRRLPRRQASSPKPPSRSRSNQITSSCAVNNTDC